MEWVTEYVVPWVTLIGAIIGAFAGFIKLKQIYDASVTNASEQKAQIKNLAEEFAEVKERLNSHENRIAALERVRR